MAERLLQQYTCAGDLHISSQVPIAQERLLRRAVPSCEIQGAAGSREGPQTTPRGFFWPQRLSALSASSQASENISFTRGVLRGFAGVLAQSVPLQEHDICLSLPCPPCLSADHSNCRITFYFQLFPLFLHTPSTSCPVLIAVACTFCGIFPHSLSPLHLCLIVLILSL